MTAAQLLHAESLWLAGTAHGVVASPDRGLGQGSFNTTNRTIQIVLVRSRPHRGCKCCDGWTEVNTLRSLIVLNNFVEITLDLHQVKLYILIIFIFSLV